MALTKIDRCEKCPAQALVSVAPGASTVPALYFCGHHFDESSTPLALQGWTVLDDERYALELAEAGRSAGGDHA